MIKISDEALIELIKNLNKNRCLYKYMDKVYNSVSLYKWRQKILTIFCCKILENTFLNSIYPFLKHSTLNLSLKGCIGIKSSSCKLIEKLISKSSFKCLNILMRTSGTWCTSDICFMALCFTYLHKLFVKYI